MERGRKTVIALVLILIFSVGLVRLSEAQAPGDLWSTPYRLSSEEGILVQDSVNMVADQYGFLHIFWTETGYPDDRSIIQYARFDGENWSDPLDIHATKQDVPIVGYTSPVVDKDGILHIMWSEGNTGPVYYSQAPAYDTLSAKQWSTPARLSLPAYRVRFKIDSKGTFHLLYANFYGSEPGVYYLRSNDQGQTWSDSARLDPDIPDNQAPLELQFALDDADGLHAVWSYLDLGESMEKSVRYAHSLDGGESWSLPITIDEADVEKSDEVRMARPRLTVQDQTVHVIWAGTSQTNREHRFSTDAGQTWSVPVRVFGELHGQSIADGLAVDAADRVHFVSTLRDPGAIWYAYWDRDRWTGLSQVNSVDVHGVSLSSAHFTRLAVRAGNQLVVAFGEGSGNGVPLYAMHRILDGVSPVPAIPTPAPTLTPTPQPSPTSTPEAPTPTSTTAAPQLDSGAVSPPTNAASPGNVIFLGIVPVLLTLGGIIVFRLLQIR